MSLETGAEIKGGAKRRSGGQRKEGESQFVKEGEVQKTNERWGEQLLCVLALDLEWPCYPLYCQQWNAAAVERQSSVKPTAGTHTRMVDLS